jgi:hypothetical protein
VGYKNVSAMNSTMAPEKARPGYAHIKIGVYRKSLDHYTKKVLVLLSHQPSGIKTVSYDLEIFLAYLEARKIRRINMDTLLEFIPYL